MRKSVFWLFFILTSGTYVGACFAAEELQVGTPGLQAKITFQSTAENKLLVSALDQEDNPVKGLTEGDFLITKGKKKAEILTVEPFETSKEIGLNIVLVVDNSFSMKERRAVKPLLAAMEEFFKIVRPIDNIQLVVFDKDRNFKVGERALHAKTIRSSDISVLRKFLTESFDRGLSSRTFLYEAMVAGIDLIRRMPEKSNKFFVVFSDGEDINSAFRSSVVETEAEGIANFEAYSLDYMPGEWKNPFLKSFAEKHGGRIWKATSATELLPIFRAFSTTLLHRYIVTYRFLDPPGGTLGMEPSALHFESLTMTDGRAVGNYVFFEEGQSEIPQTYALFKEAGQTAAFDDKTLNTALDRHKNVLNIIGQRLGRNPTVAVFIIGNNSGMGAEEDDLDLSLRRAHGVKDYLHNIWGVDRSRLKVGMRNEPTEASSADVLGGRAENQRVEIEFQPEDMQARSPEEFIVEKNEKNEIKIIPQISAEYGIASWELQILADNRPIKTLTGTGGLQPVYSFSLEEFGKGKLASYQNLQARIRVTDTTDETHEAVTSPTPITSSKREVIHELIPPPTGKVTLEPDTVTIEELTTIEGSPMLNYVFFDTGKSEIPERYILFTNQADTKSFSESGLKGTMEKYSHILNVIGKRLVAFPEVQIDIVGCNSNSGEERGKIDLSRSRAEAVRAYLRYIWGIDSSRMTVKARNLPAAPSTSWPLEGRVENQRVEIETDFLPLLGPIKSTYVEEISDTAELRVLPEIRAGYGVAKWQIVLKGDGSLIKALGGEGDLRTVYTFDLKDMGLRKFGSYREISATVEVIDKKGQNYTGPPATSSVRFIKREEQVAQRMGYKVLEKYALILFDFNSSDLREQNRAIVEQIVERMGRFPTAEVKVVGHTDNIGKEVYNMWLSERRAKAVYDQILLRMGTPSESLTYTGEGPHNPLYDNTLPEGRSLNRTVTVSIEYEKEE